MNEGVIFGAFKGITLNLAQFGLVLYPAVYFANKNGSDSKFLTFLSTYTFLDALFYPLDSLRSILYADTLGTYSFKTVATKTNLPDLYRGIPYKLIFNLPVLSGIYCTTQVGSETEALLSWAVAFLLYPLNTLKVRAQVSASSISSVSERTSQIAHSSYRGALTYILLNAFIGYSLRPIFSQEKLSLIDKEVQAKLKEERLN